MPILEAKRFFEPDPTKARSLRGLDLVGMFNDHIVPAINAMEPVADLGNNVDVDGEDALARQRSADQRVTDEQFNEYRANRDMNYAAFHNQATDYTSDDDAPGADGSSQMPSGSSEPYTGSRDLLEVVKNLEGFTPDAYGDYKQTSIGYGTRAKAGEKSISKAAAESRLKSELAYHQKRVTDHAKEHGYQFSEGQVTALTSFDFNTGRLEQLTNNGTRSPAEIAARIPAYNKADGKVSQGLVNRRRTEHQLFTQG